MAYKDHKVLCEQLRSLNFHRKVSVNNFNEPNFELVSEILKWATTLTEAGNENLPKEIDTEAQRVLLIRSYAKYFFQHLNVRLNTKNLYAAQTQAVPDLLKVTSPLYAAHQQAQSSLYQLQQDDDQEIDSSDPYSFARVKELSALRQSASDVIQSAASLHQQLNGEPDARVCREAALARELDLSKLEEVLGGSLMDLTLHVQELKENTLQLELQEKEIEEKITKKQELLDRKRNRFDTLKKIKPSWESEFEACETELSALWGEYVKKHMSLAALEEQLNCLKVGPMDTLKFEMPKIKTRIVNPAHSETEKDDYMSADMNTKLSDGPVFGDMFGSNIDSSEESLSASWSLESADTIYVESMNNNTQEIVSSEPQGKKLRKEIYKDGSSVCQFGSEASQSSRKSSNRTRLVPARPVSACVSREEQHPPANPTAWDQEKYSQCLHNTDDDF